MPAYSPYYRWAKAEPKAGDRCRLDETRGGWRVRDPLTDEVFTAYGTFENRTRVYRDGDDSLNLLPNDTEVELVALDHDGYGRFNTGQVVQILKPSKYGGKRGIVAKGSYRYHIVIPGEKTVLVDADFIAPLDGNWELTRV